MKNDPTNVNDIIDKVFTILVEEEGAIPVSTQTPENQQKIDELIDKLHALVVNSLGHFDVQSHVEEEILEGHLFETYHEFTIANGTSKYYRITTGDEPIMFLGSNIKALGGAIYVIFYEDSNYTGGNNPLSLRNRNHLSSYVDGVTYKVDPTGTVKGTRIGGTVLFAESSGNSRSPQEAAGGQGFEILKPNATYLVEFKNASTNGSATVVFKTAWCSVLDDLDLDEIQGD